LLLWADVAPNCRKATGAVVFEVPKVAGAEEPYQMPQLGPPLKDDDEVRHAPHR